MHIVPSLDQLFQQKRGRIRACRGVGAALSAAEVERFDAEHGAMLSASVPERFHILHRINAHVLRPAAAP